MYELTIILGLMLGGSQTIAETEVNKQFASMAECEQQGQALSTKLQSTDIKTIQIQCEFD
ncbi:hypothetical protein FLM48_16615 [Shewanella sp. Scap07]|uniref:hypothetical protein n=1 Tax=Shewanella sp. Scap07 TaxID=2589987 RepID=UPI0015BA34C8|nr:hypothetical protein [Shewanella sp. Scap07]QLE86546.1 hypothetical protein FLM48_16615 [Shewanella sp. Scap07]